MQIELIASLFNRDGERCQGHLTRIDVIKRAFLSVSPGLWQKTKRYERNYGGAFLTDGDYPDTKVTVIDEPAPHYFPPAHYGKHVIVRVVDNWLEWTKNDWLDYSQYYLYPIPCYVPNDDPRSFTFVYPIIDTPNIKRTTNILLVPGSNEGVFMEQIAGLALGLGTEINYNLAVGLDKKGYWEALSRADVVMSSCSNNALEALAMGCNTLIIETSDDQGQLAESLSNFGVKRYSKTRLLRLIQNNIIKDESELFVKDLLSRCNL